MASDFIRINYAGAVILLACILGGGTDQSLWSDQIVAAAMIPGMIAGFTGFGNGNLQLQPRLLVIGMLILIAMQFLPLTHSSTLPAPGGLVDPWPFFTLSPGRSLQSALFAVPLIGFALFIAGFGRAQEEKMTMFILLGMGLNIVIAVVQLSASGPVRHESFLPYDITAGMFANQNHFSTLGYLAIPLLAWRFLARRSRLAFYLSGTGLILLVLFALGSRAGMAISTVLAFFCLVWFSVPQERHRFQQFLLVAGAVIGLVAGITVLAFSSEGFGDVSRITIWSNILPAALDHFLTGTGLGSFAVVYPFYEPHADVIDTFAYHSHNDYLELFLEGGLFAVVLIVAFVVLLLRSMFRDHFVQAAGLAVLSVLLHSLVDYPLRTYAVATCFAVLSAIAFSSAERERRRRAEEPGQSEDFGFIQARGSAAR